MTSKLKLILLIGFIALFSNSYGQTESKTTKKIYYYTFSGNLSPLAKEMMETEILNMQFVTEAKIEYKAEKGSGQLRILTAEYYINQDNDFEFNIFKVKQLLVKNNLSPDEYKWELLNK